MRQECPTAPPARRAFASAMSSSGSPTASTLPASVHSSSCMRSKRGCLLRLHILDAVVVTTPQRSRYVNGVSSAVAPRRWTMASTGPRRSGSRESGPTTPRRWTDHSSCGRLARRPSAPHALGWTRGCGACSPSRAVDAESGFVGSESFSLDTHSPAGRGAVTATTIADPNRQHEQVRRRAPGGVQIAFSHGSPSRSPFPVRTSCRAWPSFLRRG